MCKKNIAQLQPTSPVQNSMEQNCTLQNYIVQKTLYNCGQDVQYKTFLCIIILCKEGCGCTTAAIAVRVQYSALKYAEIQENAVQNIFLRCCTVQLRPTSAMQNHTVQGSANIQGKNVFFLHHVSSNTKHSKTYHHIYGSYQSY